MSDKDKALDKQLTMRTAIKYAKASIYALQKSANGVNPKDIEKEMLMHQERYNEELINILVKAYEQEEKKKC